MAALEKAVTTVSAMHIVIVVESFDVTASAEQIPRTWRMTGLLSTIGSKMIFLCWYDIRVSSFRDAGGTGTARTPCRSART